MLRFYSLFIAACLVWCYSFGAVLPENFPAAPGAVSPSAAAFCDAHSDSLQLVQLYQATNGTAWENSWDLTTPMINWHGIILNPEGCVGVINLSNNKLSGYIPDLQLPSCTLLNLEGNIIGGTLPDFSGLPSLQLLILNNNQIEGNIPDFSQIPTLSQFSASRNKLFGSVPDFSNLPLLKTLELAYNNIGGILPNFTNIKNLEVFNVSHNFITGNVPNFLNLPELRFLILNNNRLEGQIPNFFVIPELRQLDLSHNRLSGNIPNFLNLRKVNTMLLDSNQLSGSIPDFSLLDSLSERLWLQDNRLSGIVPNFTRLQLLQELDIDNNELDSMPDLTNMTALLVARIRNNRFTFDDLIYNKDLAPVVSNFPQDSVGTGGVIDLQIAEDYVIDLDIDDGLPQSVYRWFKNGVLQQISNSNKFFLNNVLPADAGIYTCLINNPELPLLTLTSKQYIIRVNYENNQFNDDCQNAFTITDLDGQCHDYTMFNSTPDLFSGSCAQGANNVWFRFIAQGPNIFASGVADGGATVEIAVIEFSEADCDPAHATELLCGGSVINQNNILVPGQVYYLVVSNSNNEEGPFQLCVSNPFTPPPPPNDELCNATPVSPNGICRHGSTLSASIDYGNLLCPPLSAQSVWYRTILSEKKHRLKIDLVSNNFVGDVSIQVFELDPDCNAAPKLVPNGVYCGTPDNIFVLEGLSSGKPYYIQVSTTKPGAGSFEFCLFEEGNPLDCAENQNCNIGPGGPALLATVTGAGKVCLNGCNTGSKPALNIGNAACGGFANPTVWYRIYTDANANMLSLDVSSAELQKPQIAIVSSSNCSGFSVIACKLGADGQVSLRNVRVQPNSYYLVVVSESGGETGAFTICAETLNDSEECNISDELRVTNTSLGSPFSGPFKPGEVVTFCYRITDWRKNQCNWLQGIVPRFGNGWDPISFKPNGEPKFIISALDNTIRGYWSWMLAGEVTYNVNNPATNMSAGQVLPAGWYFINPGTLPLSGIADPDSSWGDGLLCPPIDDDIVWEMCFAMVAKGQADCSEANDCSIAMKSYSDGEVGGKPQVSCLGNQATWFNSYVDCCLEPVMDSIRDITICSGSKLTQALTSSLDPETEYNWTVGNIKDVVGPSAGSGNLIDQQLMNTGTTTGFVDYTVFAKANGCSTFPQTFRVTVPPAPKAKLSGSLTSCEGDTTFLILNFTGVAPYRFVLNANGTPMDTFTAGTTVYNHPVHPTVTTTYTLSYFKDASCGGTFSGTGFIMVRPNGYVDVDTSFCYGGSITVQNQVIQQTGIYRFKIGTSANGCDSVLRYDVTQLDSIGIEAVEIETDSGQANGSIFVFPEGGSGQYTYKWENGAQTSFLIGVKSGTYRLTITDSRGCTNDFVFEVPYVSATDEEALLGPLSLSPNPVRGGTLFQLGIEGLQVRAIKVSIFDPIGRLLKTEVIHTRYGSTHYAMEAPWAPGVYSIVAEELEGRRRKTFKLVIL